MAQDDTANRLAHQTDVIRGEGKWLLEQAQRVADGMDRAWPIMREARYRIRALENALLDLSKAYVNLLEVGRDRIVSLGGECDSVEKMESGDPALIATRAVLSKQNYSETDEA